MLLFETGELAATPPPAGIGTDKPEEYKSAIDEWRALQLMFQQMLQQFGECGHAAATARSGGRAGEADAAVQGSKRGSGTTTSSSG